MKAVIRYQADDGSVWETEEAAQQRDRIKWTCDSIPAKLRLRDRPTGNFSNGEGFVQQPTGSKDRLWEELRRIGRIGWNRDSDGPVGKLSYRASSMDDQDREWGQPYFALNPGRGKMVAL